MFTTNYTKEEILAISDRIDTDFSNQTSTFGELEEDIMELAAQVAFQNSVIRSLSTRIRNLEDKMPLIGI